MTLHAASGLMAKRIAGADLVELLAAKQTLSDARGEAAKVISEARTEAKALMDAARQSAEADRADMERQIQDHRARVLKETQIEVAAIRQLETMGAVAQLTERFEALTPWIGELVMGTVSRLVGAIEPDDRMCRILEVALATSRRDWTLRLRCHPESMPLLKTIIDRDRAQEGRFSAVTDIVEDDRLTPGGCVLESEGGLVEIGIEAQIDALRQAIGLSDAVEQPSDLEMGEAESS